MRAKAEREKLTTKIIGRSAGWRGYAGSRKSHRVRYRGNILKGLTVYSQNSDHDNLRKSMVLDCLTEMSRTFVFNPDNRIVRIVSLVIHDCFYQNVRCDREGEDQRGQRTTQRIGRDKIHQRECLRADIKFPLTKN
jgi:hypothetical protein